MSANASAYRRSLILAATAAGFIVLGWIWSQRGVAWIQFGTNEKPLVYPGGLRGILRTGRGIYIEDGYLILSFQWRILWHGQSPWPSPSDETWREPLYVGQWRNWIMSRAEELRQEARMGSGFNRCGVVFAWQTVSQHTDLNRGLAIRFWWFLILLACVTGRKIAHAIVWQRRLAAGLCPACGYDLRASKDRCPECGREIEKQNGLPRESNR